MIRTPSQVGSTVADPTDFDAAASIDLTNGVFLVAKGSAVDHADMRAAQLSSLLTLMRTDDARAFRNLGDGAQLNLMWLASQMAYELKAMLPLVAEEARKEGR